MSPQSPPPGGGLYASGVHSPRSCSDTQCDATHVTRLHYRSARTNTVRITPPSVCFLPNCHATTCRSETSPISLPSIRAGDAVRPSIVHNFLCCRPDWPDGPRRLNSQQRIPCICFGRRQPLDERRRREISAANIAWLHCTHRYVGLTPSRHRIVNLTTTVNPSSLASCRSSSHHISSSYISSRRRLAAKQILNFVRFIRLPGVGYVEGILKMPLCCIFYRTSKLERLCTAGMGTRRKSSRPRRDRNAHLPRPRHDVKISRQDRDETFVALET